MWVSGETNSRSGEQQAVSGMGAARLDRVGLDTAGAAVGVAARYLTSAWGCAEREPVAVAPVLHLGQRHLTTSSRWATIKHAG